MPENLCKSSLLKDFEQFELHASELLQLKAGSAVTNGCNQNGGMSYVDILYDGWYQTCNNFSANDDPSGWCANMTFQ